MSLLSCVVSNPTNSGVESTSNFVSRFKVIVGSIILSNILGPLMARPNISLPDDFGNFNICV